MIIRNENKLTAQELREIQNSIQKLYDVEKGE